jgi:hypothetical protein
MALQVVQRDGGGDHRVQDALGDLAHGALGAGPQDGRVGHQVADVAHEQQRAAVQRHVLAARAGVLAVGFRPRVKVLPPLLTSSVSVPFRMPSQLL